MRRKRRGSKGKRSYGKKRKGRRIPKYGTSRGGIRL